jgi:hypothetical protein
MASMVAQVAALRLFFGKADNGSLVEDVKFMVKVMGLPDRGTLPELVNQLMIATGPATQTQHHLPRHWQACVTRREGCIPR